METLEVSGGPLVQGRDELSAAAEWVALSPITGSYRYRFAKRGLDLLLSGLALLVLSPVFLLCAILVKLCVSRAGLLPLGRYRPGRPFRGYKFRTMVQNADALKAQLMQQNEMNGPVFKIRNDPRITRPGRFLRKYSIDELPQLWSVLKGDMSLVGPRPAGPHEWVHYEPWQRRKLSVTPGITCLWQVGGRNDIADFDRWVRMDLDYIDHWSLGLDLRIMWRTIFAVLRGTGT